MGNIYKAYIAVKDKAKYFKYTNVSYVEYLGIKYRIIFTNKRANRLTHIHCAGNSVLWEQLPLLPRLAGREYGDKQVISSFTDKYDGVTLFVIKGKPGSIAGLDDGMFRSIHKLDANFVNVMSEARFKEL